MDFRFDQEERDIIEQAALTMRRYLPPERLLDSDADAVGWENVAEDGWIHAGLTEEEGGAGLQPAMLAGIAEAAGGVLAGDAYVNNAVLIPRMLPTSGNPAGDGLLPPGFLVADGRGRRLRADPSSEVEWCFGVEPGFSAYYLTEDDQLLCYPPAAWRLSPIGGLGLATGSVSIEEGADPEWSASVRVVDSEACALAEVIHAAAMVGVGCAALDETVAYVKEREQFGGPIGRFQAIKHALADVAVHLEVAREAALYAALRPDEAATSIARLQAAAAIDEASRAMTQFIGGIAMTWEHSGHLYLKTAQLMRWRFGTPHEHALQIAGDIALEELAHEPR